MARDLAQQTEVLLNIEWINNSMKFEISSWLLLVTVFLSFIALAFFIARNCSFFSKGFEIDSAELGIGDSKVIIRPNIDDRKVAYQIWVELSTRKIGLPIDPDDDVISEIYDSWYKFFDVTRELIKDIPVTKVRSKSTSKIIEISIETLNLGLRPHLTKWQARFRRWYNYQLDTDKEASLNPQDIQKKFPLYDELINDMIVVNSRLMKYRSRMYELIHGL